MRPAAESQVAGSGYSAAGARRAFAQHVTGVRIDQNQAITAEADLGWSGRIGAHSDRLLHGAIPGDNPLQHGFHWKTQRTRSGRWEIAIHPPDDLPLIGQEHARYRHDQDDYAGHATDDKVNPKKGRPQVC